MSSDGPGQLPRDLSGDGTEEGRRNPSLQGATEWEGLQQEDHEALQDEQQSATGESTNLPWSHRSSVTENMCLVVNKQQLV